MNETTFERLKKRVDNYENLKEEKMTLQKHLKYLETEDDPIWKLISEKSDFIIPENTKKDVKESIIDAFNNRIAEIDIEMEEI